MEFNKNYFSRIIFNETKLSVDKKKIHKFLCIHGQKQKQFLEKIKKRYDLDTESTHALIDNPYFCVLRQGVYIHILLLPTVHLKKEVLDPCQGSELSLARDYLGSAVSQLKANCSVGVETFGLSEAQKQGLLLGIELSLYCFKKTQYFHALSTKHLIKEKDYFKNLFKENFGASLTKQNHVAVKLSLKEFKKHKDYSVLGEAVNLTRHVVNIPANVLSPKSYAYFIKDFFRKTPTINVDVWDPVKVNKNKMGLLYAVGHSHHEGSYFVKIQYRPYRQKKPKIIFVGKGITFDSGGLDIKPPAAMRLMKKDMAGSAALLGLSYFISHIRLKLPCDFYIPIAENSVSDKSFRPGDVFQSRSGRSVEIHHTDAEGRLILADALELAVESQPQSIVTVATLTGATRVGLGLDIGGLYGNEYKLCSEIFKSSLQIGDPLWMMPLVAKYKKMLDSSVSDISHAADGFGGGIRAATFLESFVKGVPWAHLDIYAWKNKPEGAYSEAGASGQAVQALGQWLLSLSS